MNLNTKGKRPTDVFPDGRKGYRSEEYRVYVQRSEKHKN
jgi:hypothetical protein